MSSPRSELAITATMIGVRLREHDSELEKVAVQMAAQEIRLATLDAASKHASDYAVALSARLERLESARIAAPVAPESAETASGVPQEPGNATRPLTLLDPHDPDGIVQTNAGEVAAALRMYRKVQGCSVAPNCGYGELQAPHVATPDGGCVETAVGFLAWLKEGEA